MLLLRGALNVACLEEVYEDNDKVYLVMELCAGGSIIRRTRGRAYDERKVWLLL
jgi:serine/threonine protein kinase